MIMTGLTYLILIIVVIFQIFTLVKQAKAKEWIWFVSTLILNPVWIIYWIVKIVKK